MMPDTSPTLVMISMGNSDAYANNRPSWTVTRPTPSHAIRPYVPAIKDA
jgi:hypothetical protein